MMIAFGGIFGSCRRSSHGIGKICLSPATAHQKLAMRRGSGPFFIPRWPFMASCCPNTEASRFVISKPGACHCAGI